MLSEKPDTSEYGSFYQGYIDLLPDSEPVLKILSEQPDELFAILEKLDEETFSYRYAPGKWSIKEVLGHIIDTETIFAYRALSFARGEKIELHGYDHEEYVENGNFNKRNAKDLLEDYKVVRSHTVRLFESFDEEMLKRRGVANNYSCSVRALAFIIAGHERHHIKLFREKYGLG